MELQTATFGAQNRFHLENKKWICCHQSVRGGSDGFWGYSKSVWIWYMGCIRVMRAKHRQHLRSLLYLILFYLFILPSRTKPHVCIFNERPQNSAFEDMSVIEIIFLHTTLPGAHGQYAKYKVCLSLNICSEEQEINISILSGNTYFVRSLSKSKPCHSKK